MEASLDPAGLVVPPVLVLSDLHLAHPASYCVEPRELRPLLQGAETVVFNGDSAELLHVKHRVSAREKLAALAEECARAGARPVFITGNHDATVSSLHALDLCDGAVFVTHGDALHPWLAPWSHDAALLKAERGRLLARRPLPQTLDDELRLAKDIGMAASHFDAKGKRGLMARALMLGKFAYQPWRAVHAVHYWASVPRRSQELRDRRRPHARLMLIGHTHRAGIWDRPGFTLVNTGSFQPVSRPLAVRFDGREALVNGIVRRHGEWAFGPELRRLSV